MGKLYPGDGESVNANFLSTMSRQEFLAWEQASRDTIDVKRCYVDLAQGDLIAGILLSQIVFWHLPAKNGAADKLMVEKDGEKWLAKGRADWWDECRITPKQYDRAAAILEGIGVIETRTMRFGGSPTKHIRVCWEAFLRDLALITMRVQGAASDTPQKGEGEGNLDIPQRGKTGLPDGEPVIPQRSKSKLPKREERPSRTGEIEIAETGNSLTETTAQTTSENTTETPPPRPVPLGEAPQQGEREEDLNASPVKKEEVKAEETERVEAMLSVLAKITGSSIEVETLRPLALECVRMEHKDAWTHTLSVLKSKMACNLKPTMPNRYAATVLKKALESPAPSTPVRSNEGPLPVARPSQAFTPLRGFPQGPAPPGAAPAEAQEPPAETLMTQGDGPAQWAMRKAKFELAKPWFKAQHGRFSGQADWEARAREIEAEAAQGT